ncbi:MAG: prepilin-type N-terminal cleavage/methylation domain-containing protein [Halanaerobiales bacterium]|nr:prepilin-type N-terminal cleavage/methylation domain-containing protein [Halanaerobiales bacterium]
MGKYIGRQEGFTILELLVVIVIIGILATIALPKFGSVRNDANIAVSKSNLKSLQTAIERYLLDNGSYPSDLSTIVSAGFIKKKTCLIPATTDAYQYGENGTDFLLYDSKYDIFASNEELEEDFTNYTGGITPSAQSL